MRRSLVELGLVVAVDGHQGIEQVCFAGGAVKVGRGTGSQGDVALGGLLLDGEAVTAKDGVEVVRQCEENKIKEFTPQLVKDLYNRGI